MDPNTTLAELRRIVGRLLDTGYGDTVPDGWHDDALAALEHVAAIDEFLTSGGFLPAEWAPATTRRRSLTRTPRKLFVRSPPGPRPLPAQRRAVPPALVPPEITSPGTGPDPGRSPTMTTTDPTDTTNTTDRAAAPPPGRLRAGELRRRVAEFLAAHPGETPTPGQIARALGRSSGAVGNALGVLASRGEAEQSSTGPVRYRATATTGAAAAPPGAAAPSTTAPSPTTASPTTVSPTTASATSAAASTGTAAATGTSDADRAATGTAATGTGAVARGRRRRDAAPGAANAAPTADRTAGTVVEEGPVTGPVTRPNGQAYHPRTLGDDGMPDVTALRKLRAAGIPALMYGPPGTGKTSVIEAAFPDAITVQGDGDTTVGDLVGEYTQNPDGTYVFVHGPLVRAMREGRALFVDDATLIPPTVLAVVYPAMDGRREIVIKAHAGEVVRAADGFYVAAGHNPGVHGAVLSDALASRFSAQIRVSTDYDLAAQLKVDRRAVRVARNLATRVEKGEIGWAPQLRELLAFQKIAGVLGPTAAAANLVGIAPEDDRETVASVVRSVFGTRVEPLSLGARIDTTPTATTPASTAASTTAATATATAATPATTPGGRFAAH